MSEVHKLDNCPQEKRLERIEIVTDGTIKQLVALNLTLTSIDNKLSSKVEVYDAHVKEGEAWRTMIMSWLAGALLIGAATACGYGIWVGTIQNDVRRLQALHPFGVSVAPVYGTK